MKELFLFYTKNAPAYSRRRCEKELLPASGGAALFPRIGTIVRFIDAVVVADASILHGLARRVEHDRTRE